MNICSKCVNKFANFHFDTFIKLMKASKAKNVQPFNFRVSHVSYFIFLSKRNSLHLK